jgi:hypothetical protein
MIEEKKDERTDKNLMADRRRRGGVLQLQLGLSLPV